VPTQEAPDIGGWFSRKHAVELFSTVLLALAGLAASWSGYQAARWSGIQSALYSQASAQRVESTRQSAKANALGQVDIVTFMAWVEAYTAGNERLQTFYRARFRAEFRPAFEAWLAAEPETNPQAPATPFAMQQYRLQAQDEAAALERKAAATFATGQAANRHSLDYVLNSVLLAMVLFLVAITRQFGTVRLQLALLGLATVLLAVGLFHLIYYPAAAI
jgi:hypothetical protein